MTRIETVTLPLTSETQVRGGSLRGAPLADGAGGLAPGQVTFWLP
jgi:hypothetical protein